MRFVLAVIKGEVIVSNRKKQELMQELRAKGFKAFVEKKNGDKEDETVSTDGSDADEEVPLDKGYDYLLSMKIWSLTMERVQELINQRNIKREELDELLSKTAERLWVEDLDALELALDDFEAAVDDEKKQEVAARKKAAGNLKKAGGGRGAKPKKKRAADSDDDSEAEADDSDFDEKPRKAAATKAKAPAPKPVATAASKVQTSMSKFVSSTAAAPKAVTEAPTKPATAKKVVAPVVAAVARKEEDVRENMSLFERLKLNSASVAQLSAPATASSSVAAPAKKKAAPAAKKAAPAPKKKQQVRSDSEEDAEHSGDDSEDDIFKSSAFAAPTTLGQISHTRYTRNFSGSALSGKTIRRIAAAEFQCRFLALSLMSHRE